MLFVFPAAAAPADTTASFCPSAKTQAWVWLEGVSMGWQEPGLLSQTYPLTAACFELQVKENSLPYIKGWAGISWKATGLLNRKEIILLLPTYITQMKVSRCTYLQPHSGVNEKERSPFTHSCRNCFPSLTTALNFPLQWWLVIFQRRVWKKAGTK